MTSCNEIRISLGALAVSALDPDEELRVREHVATCERCAAELAELSGTVELLALAKPLDLPAAVQPDQHVLAGLLAAVGEERRRARRRRIALGLAAAAVGAVVAGTGALLIADDEPAPAAVAETPTAEVRASDGPVVLEVELFARGWGTAVHGAIAGVPPGETCSLVAVGVDGRREVAATWTVPAAGYANGKLWFDGGVGLQPHETSQYEIVTPAGDVLLVAPA
jgi:anti-sigma factor RsiW